MGAGHRLNQGLTRPGHCMNQKQKHMQTEAETSRDTGVAGNKSRCAFGGLPGGRDMQPQLRRPRRALGSSPVASGYSIPMRLCDEGGTKGYGGSPAARRPRRRQAPTKHATASGGPSSREASVGCCCSGNRSGWWRRRSAYNTQSNRMCRVSSARAPSPRAAQCSHTRSAGGRAARPRRRSSSSAPQCTPERSSAMATRRRRWRTSLM